MVRKNMIGGKLNCGLSKDAKTYILLGHSCDFMGYEIPVPEGWVYITSGICGNFTYDDLIYKEILTDFFKNNEFMNSPCENYGLSKKYNYDSIVMNFHYKNAPDVSNTTCQEISFYPLSNSLVDKQGRYSKTVNEAESWICTKSGVYVNTDPNNSKYSSQDIVVLLKEKGQFFITEDQIKKIYEGSLYPLLEDVIEQTKIIKHQEGSSEPNGLYNTKHLEKAVSENFTITLSQLISLHKVSGINEGYIINPLCRISCYEEFDIRDVARRRANSLVGLNANDASDVEEFLGGNLKKKLTKRKKQIKRRTQRKHKSKKVKILKRKNKQ